MLRVSEGIFQHIIEMPLHTTNQGTSLPPSLVFHFSIFSQFTYIELEVNKKITVNLAEVVLYLNIGVRRMSGILVSQHH